jgi:hypothetical protein
MTASVAGAIALVLPLAVTNKREASSRFLRLTVRLASGGLAAMAA